MRNLLRWMITYIGKLLGVRTGLPPRPTVLVLGVPKSVADELSGNWHLFPARSLDEAQLLLSREEIPVVLCEPDSPRADWRGALRRLAGAPCRPNVVLMAATPRQPGWSEVVAAGGYDVLPESANGVALERMLRSAQSHWRSRRALEAGSPRAARK